jgi:prepilin signal peptidase PulO-like enzyme (type II secretory pathway)
VRRRNPEAAEQTPAQAKRGSRLVLYFGLLILAAVLTAGLPFPWQLGGVLLTTAAMVTGIRALVAVWRPGLRQRLAPLLVLGLLLTLLLSLSLSIRLLFWDAEVELQRCLSRARTIAANQACEAHYAEAVEERLADLTGSLGD